MQSFQVEQEHFEFATVANDRRKDQTSVLLALAAVDPHQTAAKLIRLEVKSDSEWPHTIHKVKNPTHLEDVLKNTIILENNQVLLAFEFGFVILNEELDYVEDIRRSQIDPCVKLIFNIADNLTKDSFYMAFKTRDATKFKYTYTGTDDPSREAWIVKSKFNTEDLNFELTDAEENSLLLKQAYVNSVYEFEAQKLLIHLDPTDLIIVNDMQVKQMIKDSDSGNV